MLSGCMPKKYTITAVDKLGNLHEFVLDGIRDLSIIDGEFSEKAFDAIYAEIVEAHMEFESAISDPDGDYELGMSKARRILRKYMGLAGTKYVFVHAANDPKNLNVFMVLCNHAISTNLLLRNCEVAYGR